MKETKRYHCNTCNTSFSVTVNTIFNKTKTALYKWFYLILLMSSGKKLPSIRYLANELDVTKDTIMKMCFKIKTCTAHDRDLIDKIINSITNDKGTA